ncbi:MAG: hypothetical protein AAF567_05900 [Actinomycetota bacterium]
MLMRGRIVAVLGAVWLAAGSIAVAGCSSTDRSTEAFCEQLAIVTGPTGAEVTLVAGDPGRIDAIVGELELLLERSPDQIATTVVTLIDFFQAYQVSPREDRRALIVERQTELDEASAVLDAYALEECGLFLQRAVPTPIAGSDPGIEATE